ncbi:MAG TPA: thrombospondin type 3 repeat-containing protein, partial [bacterium]|nr:thrombospondin type 3 repeat-containing protein [bacterium]
MKKGLMFLLFVFLFFQFIYGEITIYEEVGKDPSDAELEDRANEAQGIASDYSYWFFSNRDGIYRYDDTFDNVDLSIDLSDINEMIEGVTCDHIGGIDYVKGEYNKGHVYAGVDTCNKTTWIPADEGNYDTIDDSQEALMLYIHNKYSHLVTKYSAEETFGGEGGLLSEYVAFYRLTYSLNGNNVENCILISADNETWIPLYCYQKTSYLMEFDADTLEFEGSMEFITADGLPIKSAASTSHNPIDGLFYNQCPENVTLNVSEKSRNLNSICGFDFDESNHALILKSMINLGSQHPRHLTDDWSNQGGTFAENGVFLYVQDDEHAEGSNMTGFQVYAPDYGKFRQDDGTGIKKYNVERFAMGNIKMNPDFGNYGRWDELEGITVWRNSPLGGDIHIILLHNEYTDDYVNTSDDMSLYHFKSGDVDNDGVDDMIDNCPLDSNSDQSDFDMDKIGNVCDDDIDGDGFVNDEDSCPVLYDESNRKMFFCVDIDEDEVCDDSERQSCKYLFDNNLLSHDVQDSIDSQSLKRRIVILNGLRNILMYEDDIRISFVDNCPTINNPFVNEESEIMFGVDPANKDAKTGVGAFNHPKANSYSFKYWNWGVSYNDYYWQPDHDLDGKGDACDNGDPDHPDDVKTRYSRVFDAGSFTRKDIDPFIRNEYLKIDMIMYGQNKSVNDTKPQSLRYCNLPIDQILQWGEDGKCTNTKKSETYKNLTYKVADYSFSHGSEP